MFARPSYLCMSDGEEVMTTQLTAESFMSVACADLNGADTTLGEEVREPLVGDLPGDEGAFRRLGLMCASKFLPTESHASTLNTAPLSFKTSIVFKSTHDLRNGSPIHQPGLTLTLYPPRVQSPPLGQG